MIFPITQLYRVWETIKLVRVSFQSFLCGFHIPIYVQYF